MHAEDAKNTDFSLISGLVQLRTRFEFGRLLIVAKYTHTIYLAHMTIKTNEYWIDEPFDLITKKIKLSTRLVKFGLFNSFPKSFAMYQRPWIGEINEKKMSFKMFRTKGSENTSDLSVVGKYAIRGSRPVIVVKHKIHFTGVLGMFGLFVFVIAVLFLLQKKGIVLPLAVQVIVLTSVIVYYAYTILKDLRMMNKKSKIY
jgi:hypothetical protein